MRLLLVRHGETDRNREGRVLGQGNQTLTEKGRKQAAAVAGALTEEGITTIYSSPLKRAVETAEMISDKLGLPVQVVDDLAEVDAGALDGMTSKDMRARYPDFMALWDRDPGSAVMPGGESLAHAQQRAWRSAQSFLDEHPDGTVVAVSHNFTIGTLVCKALELPLASFRHVRIDLGSVSIVELREGRNRVVLLNDRCHLVD
ncbi:MAG: histidine phosphatase family protein [Dehalococcoidia bacterium]